MPTTQNVDRIIADFSGGRKQYAAAHIFFMEGDVKLCLTRLTGLLIWLFRLIGTIGQSSRQFNRRTLSESLERVISQFLAYVLFLLFENVFNFIGSI